MEKEILKELKEVLGVKAWNEIKTKEQFFDLIPYMYSLDDPINEEIIKSIDNIEMLIEDYFNECIELIIDHEPSIMVALVDMNSFLMEIIEEEAENIRETIAYELKNFSKWLMVDSKVKYIKDKDSFDISVFAALTIIRENQGSEKDKNIKLFLITERRQNLLKDLQELVRYGIDFGESPYFGGGIDGYDSEGMFEEVDEYEDDYYLN